MLKEIDPEGSELRRRHRLKRQVNVNQGPDYARHLDGLKPFGFAIHEAIDGYSRKVFWLRVLRSYNSPNNIAALYLSCVEELQDGPVKIITDLGTENALAAVIHSFLNQDTFAHQYVPSPRNQTIEYWWSYFVLDGGENFISIWNQQKQKVLHLLLRLSVSGIVFQLFYKIL